MFLKSRQSRRLSAGVILIAVPVISVLAYRGRQSPWIATAPAYRQAGPFDAPVTLVEFSDFQCPACAHAVMAVKQLRALHDNHLRVVFKHLPWDFHQWAKTAAIATECAGKQGKFWEMHDLLYIKQAEWGENENNKGEPLIDSYSRSLPLDRKSYEECLKDPATAALIESDKKESEERWIHSTPTFFINGKRFVGAGQLRAEGLREIDRILKSKKP